MDLSDFLAPTVFVAAPDGSLTVVDMIAVQRTVTGDEPPLLTTDEADLAARILTGQGMPLREVLGQIRLQEDALKPVLRRPAQQRQAVGGCGTRAGYLRHRRRGETPCEGCRAGNAAADRRYRLTGSTGGPVVPAA